VNLAEQGFTEPIDILDSRERYIPAQPLDGLGTSRLIKEGYFKALAKGALRRFAVNESFAVSVVTEANIVAIVCSHLSF
jgi:hypothetical protein